MTGSNVRYCTENGVWVPEQPKCLGYHCEIIKQVENVHITVLPDVPYDEYLEDAFDFDFGMKLEFSCVEGELVGEKILTCRQNGQYQNIS